MKSRKKGLLLHPDDLEIGQLVTVHHWKNGRAFGMGHAMKLMALNLPYAVTQPLPPTRWHPITLDLRDAILMPVTEDYAKAQADVDPTEGPFPAGPDTPKPNPFLDANRNDP